MDRIVDAVCYESLTFGYMGGRQARGQGISSHAIARRLRSGDWQRLHRGTYAAFSGTPPREARLWAAVVRAGRDAVLSHETAAEIQRLTDKPSSKIHVTVPAGRNPARGKRIPGIVVHRARNVACEPLPPWQLPRTPVAETVLDLANAARTFDDAYGWLTRATGRELVTVPQLRAALAVRSRIRWRGLLAEALAEAADGVMSPLERRYARDVERAHGLPAARRQARRELAGGVRFLDNYYAEFRLCVELDGSTSHPPEQKWADAGRDNDNLFRDDVATVRFGLLDVTTRRCAQATRLAALFLRRGWDGAALRPCGPQCPVGRLLSNHRVQLRAGIRYQVHTIRSAGVAYRWSGRISRQLLVAVTYTLPASSVIRASASAVRRPR
jgi:Transcriptional regulator, AbiEi antitoxin